MFRVIVVNGMNDTRIAVVVLHRVTHFQVRR